MPKAAKKVQNRRTQFIYDLLKARFPRLPADVKRVVYQYNPVAIRMRVVDRMFAGKTYLEREALMDEFLQQLPEDIERRITLMLLLTPKEAKDPNELMNLEFDDPTGERL